MAGAPDTVEQEASAGAVYRLLRRVIDVRPAEIVALGWSWTCICSLLPADCMLRPNRDEIGVAGGVQNLQWLFPGTLVGMLLVNPAFSALVSRLTRVGFISVSYRFFMVNLALFAVALHVASAEQTVWVGRAFFRWVAVPASAQ